MIGVVGWLIPTQYFHILISRIYNYVNLFDKRDFAEVLGLISFEMWKLSCIIQKGPI